MTQDDKDVLLKEAENLQYKINTRPEFLCGHVICDQCLKLKNRFCPHVICEVCSIELANQNTEYEGYLRRIWEIENLLRGEANVQ